MPSVREAKLKASYPTEEGRDVEAPAARYPHRFRPIQLHHQSIRARTVPVEGTDLASRAPRCRLQPTLDQTSICSGWHDS